MDITQIEADVVFVVVNPSTNQVAVFPYWECDMTDDQLIDQAANIGLRFAESCGSGHAEVTIHDFRTHDMPV